MKGARMIKPIVTSSIMLRLPSDEATPEDIPAAQDLLETFEAHRHECVGMAANMIGVRKRIIVFQDGPHVHLMFNPEIIKGAGEYRTKEGCLSLTGQRDAMRWRKIKVAYQDEEFNLKTKTFTGDAAQVIQHEVDHCNGIVI